MVQQLAVTLRLYFRNRMGLLYGYLFPVIFLVAFSVLYRHEDVPLARHMGELLTVTVLGGACFGLPTTLVAERERGVWRRYRLAPVPIGSLVASTMIGRYLILITAGVLQIALAMIIGMPAPQHLFALWVSFTFVSFAFLGLGLVIATMADNVPAVQALGQCIFLPMLIIGGVAVPLYVLPDWAQHISAFFPGRYAVQAVQAAVTGDGLDGARFSLFALLVIGAAAVSAGAMMFRWDAQQRFMALPRKGWVVVAVGAWAAVGLLAEADGRVITRGRSVPAATAKVVESEPPIAAPVLTPQERAAASSARENAAPTITEPDRQGSPKTRATKRAAQPRSDVTARPPSRSPAAPAVPSPVPPARVESAPGETASAAPAKPPRTVTTAPDPEPWRMVSMEDISRPATFAGLPPDEGVVTPLAPEDEEPDPLIGKQLERMRENLIGWEPGLVDDPVQRVRNYVYVAVVPDMFQMPIERYVPWIVLERLEEEFIREDLLKLLYWVGRRPFEGDDSAIDHLRPLGLENGPHDIDELRRRTSIYARKLLRRLLTP